MPFCPDCGTKVTKDTRFCPECGRPLAVGRAVKGESKKKPNRDYMGVNEEGPKPRKRRKGLKVLLAILIISLISFGVAHSLGGYKQPPYYITSNEKVHLVPNKYARDPTWDELTIFLKNDETDIEDYNLLTFPCGAFAQELYNNAEAQGIRAAWVIIRFSDTLELHALNAFQTTDKGLVYVDCTGKEEGVVCLRGVSCMPTDWDKIAYVEVGKELGFISLDYAYSPNYSFYEGYQAEEEAYSKEVESYNQDVEAYNKATENYFYSYSELRIWYDRLQEEYAKLENIRSSDLGDFRWSSIGVVSSVEIYW
jgi:hypothetical protein